MPNNNLEKQFVKFLNAPKKVHINTDAILSISNYAKFLKETLTKKRKLSEHEKVTLYEEYIAILQYNIPPKLIYRVSLYLAL